MLCSECSCTLHKQTKTQLILLQYCTPNYTQFLPKKGNSIAKQPRSISINIKHEKSPSQHSKPLKRQVSQVKKTECSKATENVNPNTEKEGNLGTEQVLQNKKFDNLQNSERTRRMLSPKNSSSSLIVGLLSKDNNCLKEELRQLRKEEKNLLLFQVTMRKKHKEKLTFLHEEAIDIKNRSKHRKKEILELQEIFREIKNQDLKNKKGAQH